jgi:hypothetical protein
MLPMLLPLGALASAIFLLGRDKPKLSPEEIRNMTRTRQGVRFFRAEVAEAIATLAASYALEPVDIEEGPAGCVLFRLAPLADDDGPDVVTAREAMIQASEDGAAILGSLSLGEPGPGALIMFAPVGYEVLARPESQLAVLFAGRVIAQPVHAPAISPVAGGETYDRLQQMLGDEDETPVPPPPAPVPPTEPAPPPAPAVMSHTLAAPSIDPGVPLSFLHVVPSVSEKTELQAAIAPKKRVKNGIKHLGPNGAG